MAKAHDFAAGLQNKKACPQQVRHHKVATLGLVRHTTWWQKWPAKAPESPYVGRAKGKYRKTSASVAKRSCDRLQLGKPWKIRRRRCSLRSAKAHSPCLKAKQLFSSQRWRFVSPSVVLEQLLALPVLPNA